MTIRTSTLAAVAALSVVLIGCGGGAEPDTPTETSVVTETETVEPAAEAAAPTLSSTERQYVRFVRHASPAFVSRTGEQIVEIGEHACDMIEAGMKPQRVTWKMAGIFDIDVLEAADVIGAAMGDFCPELGPVRDF